MIKHFRVELKNSQFYSFIKNNTVLENKKKQSNDFDGYFITV